MAHLRHLLLLALALVFVYPLPVVALEILELNGGSITFTGGSSVAQVNITGPRLGIVTVQQQVFGGYNFRCDVLGASPCTPGTTQQVGGVGGGGDFLGGTATLDGNTHFLGGSGGGPAFDGLIFSISAFVSIPQFGSISSAVLEAPFGLTGQLFRSGVDCFPNPSVCSAPPFSVPGTPYDLQGQGVFRGAIHRVNVSGFDFWETDSFEFDLQPTPEPATLFLWGTSAASLAAFARRRRHEIREHVRSARRSSARSSFSVS
jgi:hypothetical protein